MKVGALGTFDDITFDVGSACASACRFGVRLGFRVYAAVSGLG